MCVLRLVVPALIVCMVLAGCGKSGAPPPVRTAGTVAMVGSTTISQRAVQQYVNYALHFYSWVDASQPRDGATSCSTRSSTAACVTLRRQVLHRLLEEQVVAKYAAHNGIELSKSDIARVERELKQLRAPQAGTAKLFTNEGISPAFMRTVLQNQLLVKRVEAAVVGKAALTGPSFRLRKYVFGADRQSYRSAVDLATGGVNDIPGHTSITHWVAAYRLPPHVRSLVDVASKGDYVGPTLEGTSYVVYQILGRGNHRYGLPARQQIMARTFKAWLGQALAKLQPKCVLGNGQTAPCDGFNH